MPDFRDIVKDMLRNVESVVLDKPLQVKAALAGFLAGGHILLEDVPGVAKTMLARAIAVTSGCSFVRIQCTPDLLPSDIIGVSVFNQQSQEFEFRKGPIFHHIVVADEVNRATPRTQSALLEAMAENQVSADGVTYPLEQPFMVFATQNPVEHEGTFPLPEAQLDRFMMRISLGYPSLPVEIQLLERTRLAHPIDSLAAVTDPPTVRRMQRLVRDVFVHEKVREYIVRIIQRTRDSVHLTLGASPRASMMLFRAAQGFAAVQGRAYVVPDDVKTLVPWVLEHRLLLNPESRLRRVTTSAVLREILKEVPIPTGSVTMG